MQQSWQERGKVGLVDAGAEFRCGVFDPFERREQVAPPFGQGVGATVGQLVLCLRPDSFIGVEFRGVCRQALEVNAPGEPGATDQVPSGTT